MPNQICVECGGANDSIFLRNAEDEKMCNDCRSTNSANKKIKYEIDDKEDSEKIEIKNENNDDESSISEASEKGTRKRKRASEREAKSPTPSTSEPLEPEENAQAIYVGEPPAKAPTVPAPIVISDFIFFKGNYMQAGDVVSITDVEGGTYYAQVRQFVTDHDSVGAVITWLLPTRASPNPDIGFSPATYIMGPEEETPRKLDYLRYVMHLPTDYYHNRYFPLSHTDAEINRCYG